MEKGVREETLLGDDPGMDEDPDQLFADLESTNDN